MHPSTKRTTIHRLPLITALTCLAVLAVGPALAASPQEEANQRLVERLIREVLSPGNLDQLDRFINEDGVVRFCKAEELRRSLFPDLSYEILDLVAAGDRVVVRYRLTGTHTGDRAELSQGPVSVPASHGDLDIEEVALYTVAGGKLHQEWLFSDRLAVAQALGYTVTPPPGSAEAGE